MIFVILDMQNIGLDTLFKIGWELTKLSMKQDFRKFTSWGSSPNFVGGSVEKCIGIWAGHPNIFRKS